jgi:hypothetical protein
MKRLHKKLQQILNAESRISQDVAQRGGTQMLVVGSRAGG